MAAVWDCSAPWHYGSAVCTSSAGLHGPLAVWTTLLNGTVGLHCSFADWHHNALWHCRTALPTSTVGLHCKLAVRDSTSHW